MTDRLNAWRRSHEAKLTAIVFVVGLIFSLMSPGFFTLGNFKDLLESHAVPAIMAAGLLVVLIAGGIDVSFAAIAAVSQYLVAVIIIRWTGNWMLALVLSAVIGAGFGLVNALLIHLLKAPPVIVTIATMTLYFSVLMAATQGSPLYDLPDWFTAKFSVLGLPFPVAAAGLLLLITAFLLQRLSLGRQLFGLGGNSEAARRLGCPIGKLRGVAYGFSGAMAGLSGLLQAHRVEEVVPNALVGRELDVLAAVVLGGASLAGGAGTVTGTILGILLLAILQNGLTLLGVSSYWFGLVTGIVILASVSTGAMAQRRQQKGSVARATR